MNVWGGLVLEAIGLILSIIGSVVAIVIWLNGRFNRIYLQHVKAMERLDRERQVDIDHLRSEVLRLEREGTLRSATNALRVQRLEIKAFGFSAPVPIPRDPYNPDGLVE